MAKIQFKDFIILSNNEISKLAIQAEKELFDLRFKKATRQPFKSHEIKEKKRQLTYLKNILTLRINTIDKKQNNIITKL